jgi:aminoglycoside phosphotransferase (APT) family kinase protein
MLVGTPTILPGFRRRDELVHRYAERSGADVSGIDYYVALGYWKYACIAEGILARYRGGAMGSEHDVDTDRLAEQVVLLADAAVRTLTDGR